MYITAFFIIVLVCFAMIYLLVRKFLSESFTPNGIVRYFLLIIIGVLMTAVLLYIYARVGIESGRLENLSILAALTFGLWLEIKKNQSEGGNKVMRRSLLVSCLLFAVLPIVINVIFQ